MFAGGQASDAFPTKHWFLHEAGFHLGNVGFLPTPPPQDTVCGENRVVVMADTVNAVALGTPEYGICTCG
jgi:hypothetical protein